MRIEPAVRFLVLGLVLAVPASTLHAQMFRAEGYPIPVGLTVCLGSSHILIDPCTGERTFVTSSEFNLDLRLCASLSVRGQDIGFECPIIDVQRISESTPVCPVDCDANGLNDGCAVALGLSPDCNSNGTPDLCDIDGGLSVDLNGDGTPDECENRALELENGQIQVTLSGRHEISWDAERGFNLFNVYRGDMDFFRTQKLYTQFPTDVRPLSAQFCHLAEVSLTEAIDLLPGQIAYYLISGVGGGVEGSIDIDADSGVVVRPNSFPCLGGPDLDVAVRTDKAVYAPGEGVLIDVVLTNLSEFETIRLAFPTSCQTTFRVETRSGSSLYFQHAHADCPLVITQLTLGPGETRTDVFHWEQIDDALNPVTSPVDLIIRGEFVDQASAPEGITGISIR